VNGPAAGRNDAAGGEAPHPAPATDRGVAPDLAPAADFLRARFPWGDAPPEVFAVLGSGLGFLADALEEAVSIPFGDVPGFPGAAVEGHAGRVVMGMLEGRRALLQAGRFHVYEGHALGVVVLPVRIAAALGTPVFLVTNAAGGVNRRFGPGTLMLIEDHLNLMGRNPLVGAAPAGEPRFPDLSQAYDPELRSLARRVALERGIALEGGVYAAVTGPSYETPAEVRMIGILGGDAVGMSTVPEVIAARSAGMRVLGISLITNPGAGLSPEPLSHEEVLEAGREASPRFERLVRGVVREM
jgi:purine-nucleoside phosphorylase